VEQLVVGLNEASAQLASDDRLKGAVFEEARMSQNALQQNVKASMDWIEKLKNDLDGLQSHLAAGAQGTSSSLEHIATTMEGSRADLQHLGQPLEVYSSYQQVRDAHAAKAPALPPAVAAAARGERLTTDMGDLLHRQPAIGARDPLLALRSTEVLMRAPPGPSPRVALEMSPPEPGYASRYREIMERTGASSSARASTHEPRMMDSRTDLRAAAESTNDNIMRQLADLERSKQQYVASAAGCSPYPTDRSTPEKPMGVRELYHSYRQESYSAPPDRMRQDIQGSRKTLF